MRSQILAKIARVTGIAGHSEEASALLAKGLADTPLKKINPTSLKKSLLDTIEIQGKVGASAQTITLFNRIRILLKQIPNLKPQVAILSQMATALVKIGKRKEAQDDLDHAWRLAWTDTKHKDFSEMLSFITDSQLAAGLVIQAFDTAARIPDNPADISDQKNKNIDATIPSETPRNRALRAVATAAGRIGQPKLSMRAVRAINDETSRAHAVAQIAIAVAEAEQR